MPFVVIIHSAIFGIVSVYQELLISSGVLFLCRRISIILGITIDYPFILDILFLNKFKNSKNLLRD